MSQVTEYTIPGSPLTMAQLQTQLQNLFAAAVSQNAGASAPENPFDGMPWVDTSGSPSWALKLYSEANGWREMATVNITTGAWSFAGLTSAANTDVASQSEHDSPESVEKLARLDRLWNAPGWHHVETREVSTAVAAIDFDIPAEFSAFKFSVINFSRNGEKKISCRFSYDGGLSFDDSVDSYQLGIVFTGPSGGSVDDHKIDLSNTSISNANIGISGNYYLFPADGGTQAHIQGTFFVRRPDGSISVGVSGGRRGAGGRIEAIRFFNTEGTGNNIESGVIVMEGVRS